MAQRVLIVVGTRPNFVKVAPVLAELARRPESFDCTLVHTGQHYDDEMSRVFFEELNIGPPKHRLRVGSGSHSVQTARVMESIEPVIEGERPDVVLVPGDVNSTLAAALVAAKLGVPIGHIEAGLRSFDRSMPEEINRIVTDSLADTLFVHSPEAIDNLTREGAPLESIHAVGNTMVDTLIAMQPRIERAAVPEAHGLRTREYVVVTLHRPALVDGPLLADAVEALRAVAREIPVVFPVHPRTRGTLEALGLDSSPSAAFRLMEPLGYIEFLGLLAGAAGAITDSGGIQEETTFLGVPCFTLRDNTERPITVELGTNVLLGLSPERILEVPALIDAVRKRARQVPPLWDGQAARRVVDVLAGDSPRLGFEPDGV